MPVCCHQHSLPTAILNRLACWRQFQVVDATFALLHIGPARYRDIHTVDTGTVSDADSQGTHLITDVNSQTLKAHGHTQNGHFSQPTSQREPTDQLVFPSPAATPPLLKLAC